MDTNYKRERVDLVKTAGRVRISRHDCRCLRNDQSAGLLGLSLSTRDHQPKSLVIPQIFLLACAITNDRWWSATSGCPLSSGKSNPTPRSQDPFEARPHAKRS